MASLPRNRFGEAPAFGLGRGYHVLGHWSSGARRASRVGWCDGGMASHSRPEAAMKELFFAAGQWLGLIVFLFGACLVIRCAAEEIRNVPQRLGPITIHDWDAPDRTPRNARRMD